MLMDFRKLSLPMSFGIWCDDNNLKDMVVLVSSIALDYYHNSNGTFGGIFFILLCVRICAL